ncbi:MAG TPA: hypothetical protein VIJ86_11590 [Acidimicrobiales bacterium]
MLHRRLNRAQRVVIVVALGFAFFLLGDWLTILGTHLPYGSAEFTNINTPDIVGGFYPWVRFTIWMLLLAIWVGVSIPLLSNRKIEPRES